MVDNNNNLQQDRSTFRNKSALRGKSFGKVKSNISMWLLLLPSVTALFIVMWSPIFQGFYLSFFKMKGYDAVSFNGIYNYIIVLTDAVFIKTLINTFSYVIWSLIIGFIPPIIIAIILNEMVHFKKTIKFFLYFPAVTPMVATALIWYFLFQPGQGGVLNMILGVFKIPNQVWLQDPNMTIPLIVFSMTWKGMGSTMLIYLASLQGINQELYEAATIDGAGILRKVRSITLPQIAPIVVLMFVRQIVSVFQVMMEPMLMTDGGPNNASLSLNLNSYYYAFRYLQPDKALALGTITFVILLVLTIFYFKVKKKVEDF